MTKVVTDSGFEVEVDAETLQDSMEFLDAIIAADSGDLKGIPTLMSIMLNQDDKKRLYEHCHVDGRTSIRKINTEIKDILSKMGGQSEPVKN